MARIRSIHPGIFTDDGFVTLSSDAQVFLFGLWTEADDQGVFEWKPITLKIRLRGGKDGPVEPLLEELVLANCIRSYELDGRKYGAVRNFRRFQRPKKPNSVHPITPEIRTYVALSDDGSELSDDEEGGVLHQCTTSGEKSPQMEDGGGRMEDVESSLRSDLSDAKSVDPPISRTKTAKKTAIPPLFPGLLERQWAVERWKEEGRPDLCDQIDAQIAQFCDHHASKGSRFADWAAAWRTWVRNAMEFNRAPRGSPSEPAQVWKPRKVV